jgi:hypothetical protein
MINRPELVKEITEFAEKHGWAVIWSSKTGLSFQKNDTRIWRCADGWQCADLNNGAYINHRGLKKNKTLHQLLEEN